MNKFSLLIVLNMLVYNSFGQLTNCSSNDTSICFKLSKYPDSFPLAIEKKWESRDEVLSLKEVSVVDVNNDCIPEIIAVGFGLDTLLIIDSQTGKTIKKIKTVYNNGYSYVLNDIDGDLIPEIFVLASSLGNVPLYAGRIVCYNLDGSERWISDQRYDQYKNQSIFSFIHLADFDFDNNPEIYVNNKIFNAKSGVKLADGGNFGAGLGITSIASSIAGQFDDNKSDLELAAGYTIYKVSIVNLIGMAGNSMIAFNTLVDGKYRDGFTSAGDINNDGILDAVVTTVDISNEAILYAHFKNGNTTSLIAKAWPSTGLNNNYIGTAFISKINNKIPSIIVSRPNRLHSYIFDSSNALKLEWTLNTIDESGSTVGTFFDLNNDGFLELIYRDEKSLKLFDPTFSPPILLSSLNCESLTGFEYPVIANIDNSGYSKICIPCAKSNFDVYGKLTVFGSPDSLPGWTPARGIWNQYGYNPVQVNDDGTIPQFQPNQATYQGGRYNNFMVQASLLDSNGMYRAKAPSIFGSIRCVDVDTSGYTVTFDLVNRADASTYMDAGMTVSFYDGNPETTGTLIHTYLTTDTIFRGETVGNLTFTTSQLLSDRLFMVINTDRNTNGILVDSNFIRLECDFTDNVYQYVLPKRDTITKSICTGETYDFYGQAITSAGSYQHKIINNQNCDSIFIRLDIDVNYIKNTQSTLSACDSISINGTLYYTTDTYTFQTLTSLGCDSIHTLDLTISASSQASIDIVSCDTARWENQVYTQSGNYKYVRTNIAGCDSIVSLQVEINRKAMSTINISRCTGQTYDFYGQTLSTSGTYQHTLQTIEGCDSVVTLQLLFNNNIQSSITHSFCTGDSILIGSSWVKDGGILTQNLQSEYGCDSTVTHTITSLPSRAIATSHDVCAGDSIRIGGAWIRVSGLIIEELQTINGCDSTVSHNVFVRAPITTNITQQICNGDSIKIHGIWQSSSGDFTNVFASQNGCDSTSSVSLKVKPKYGIFEERSICVGDSTYFVDTWIKTAGSYQRSLSTTDGCDSILSLSLTISPFKVTNLTYDLCQGDSIYIIDQYVKSAGLYLDTTNTSLGCDEIIRHRVDLLMSSQSIQLISLCPDSSLIIAGQTIDKAGVYNIEGFTNAVGCDSSVVVTVMETPRSQAPTVEIDCDKPEYIVTIPTVADWWYLDTNAPNGLAKAEYKIGKEGDTLLLSASSIYFCKKDYLTILPPIPAMSDIPQLSDQQSNAGDAINVDIALDAQAWKVVWSPSALVACDTCLKTTIKATRDTTIEVTLTHTSGCVFTRMFRIVIEPSADIIIPNIFNPSGTANPTWSFTVPTGYNIQDIRVYDRWGEMVHAQKNTNSVSWDGLFLGRVLNPNVYIYVIKIIDPSGKVIIKKGDVTLVR